MGPRRLRAIVLEEHRWERSGSTGLLRPAVMHSLDKLHDTQFRVAFALTEYSGYASIVVGLVLLWELLFPYHLAMYLTFVEWDAVRAKYDRRQTVGAPTASETVAVRL